jgi:hypothetical protein
VHASALIQAQRAIRSREDDLDLDNPYVPIELRKRSISLSAKEAAAAQYRRLRVKEERKRRLASAKACKTRSDYLNKKKKTLFSYFFSVNAMRIRAH